MFRVAYIFSTSIAKLLLPIAGLFSLKLKTFYKQRQNQYKPAPNKVKYWIHAASLGEYEMAIPLVEKLAEQYGLHEILITIFSPSGYLQAAKGQYAARLMYLPLDTKRNVLHFYRDYAPQKAIFIRYDFWFNYIYEGQKLGTEFYLVNGRFQANHFFFKSYGKPYFDLLKKFKGIFTSDRASEEMLRSKEVYADFLGDTRFDRVAAIAHNAKKYPEIEKFKAKRTLLMVGSSWADEEDLVLQILEQNMDKLAIIIAPHDLKRADQIKAKFSKYLPKKYTENNFGEQDQVLILDTIGMLSSMYQYVDLALIGGGFSGALHNILEPAVWGCPIFYGPIFSKFPEATDFIMAGFGFKISDAESFVKQIDFFLNNTNKLAEVKAKSKQFTKEQIGASGLIYDQIVSNT